MHMANDDKDEFIRTIIDGISFTTTENTRIPQQTPSLAETLFLGTTFSN
ncbi:2388_t:CDS:2 [Dentiscutata heterogama]|uniref:2388_t:CDS:1 n=1 Tax=Dentiscutata heterogama TaxID=1316150 RepID=A0ACA9JYN4_9GLOM|nr:2388_t:CDS:2 [Dentiscutata heterogama]